MDDKDLLEQVKRYKWTIILAAVALIFAVSVISYGFFKTVFLFACLAAGAWGGLTLDKRAARKNSEDSFRHD